MSNFDPFMLFYPGGQLIPAGTDSEDRLTIGNYLSYLGSKHKNNVISDRLEEDQHYATLSNTYDEEATEYFFDKIIKSKAILAYNSSDKDFPFSAGVSALNMPLMSWKFKLPRMMLPRKYLKQIKLLMKWRNIDDGVIASVATNRNAPQTLDDWLREWIHDESSAGGAGSCKFVSNPTKMTLHGATSLVFAKLFCNAMDNFGLKKRLFSAHTCNNLHNMSAYLSFYAFLRHAIKDRPNWIVNFDGHADKGEIKTRKLKVGNSQRWVLTPEEGIVENGPWGAFLPRFFSNSGYVVLQTGTRSQSGQEAISWASSDYFGESQGLVEKTTPLKYDREKYLNKLKSLVPDNSNIYMTIDRDSIQCTCTGWGSGVISPTESRAFVAEAIELLVSKGCYFVGFDLSGFPGNLSNESSPVLCQSDYRQALKNRDRTGYDDEVDSHTYPEDPWFMVTRDIGIYLRLMDQIDSVESTGDPRFQALLDSVPLAASWPDAYAMELAGKVRSNSQSQKKLLFEIKKTGAVSLGSYDQVDTSVHEKSSQLLSRYQPNVSNTVSETRVDVIPSLDNSPPPPPMSIKPSVQEEKVYRLAALERWVPKI